MFDLLSHMVTIAFQWHALNYVLLELLIIQEINESWILFLLLVYLFYLTWHKVFYLVIVAILTFFKIRTETKAFKHIFKEAVLIHHC